jgi:hypothetical protein
VTGSVKYVFSDLNSSIPVVTQTITRETSGTWKISIEGTPAGDWLGSVIFKDASGTHSEVSAPLDFTVLQGPTPPPSPTKKPVLKPVFDSCKNQIKN